MAIYHLSAQIIGRNAGRSATAAAAYRSGTKLESEYTGLIHDFTNKSGIVYSEIMLPSNAPDEYGNREILWNAVESSEKSCDAQLAREINMALPVELSLEEQIELIRTYAYDNFVSDGMIADIAIHNPARRADLNKTFDAGENNNEDEMEIIHNNPHAHVMLTIRPMDEKGKWQPKRAIVYVCKRENREQGFTSDEIRLAKAEGWEKQYKYQVDNKQEWLTPSQASKIEAPRISKHPKTLAYGRLNPTFERWNSKESILTWRKNWEIAVNTALEKAGCESRIDCRSYEERGLDIEPQIHVGPSAQQMDKKSRRKGGAVIDRAELNREIKKINKENQTIQKSLCEIEKEISEKKTSKQEKIYSAMAKHRADMIRNTYTASKISLKMKELEKIIQAEESSIRRIRNVEEVMKQKNSISEKRISEMEDELGSLNIYQINRREELIDGIQEERNAIADRNNYFRYMLREEGFVSVQDVSSKEKQLDKLITDYEKMKDQYAKLDQEIQKTHAAYEMEGKDYSEDVDVPDRWKDLFRQYEKKVMEGLKEGKSRFYPALFLKAKYQVDKSIGLGIKAASIMKKAYHIAEEEKNRGHS